MSNVISSSVGVLEMSTMNPITNIQTITSTQPTTTVLPVTSTQRMTTVLPVTSTQPMTTVLPVTSSQPMSSSTTVVRPTTSPSLGSGSGNGTSSLPTDPTEPSGTNTLVPCTFSIILVTTIILAIF